MFGEFSDAAILEVMSRVNLILDLDMVVEENGRNFSGGERQKIAIGRALLKQVRTIILDEAVSNIDSESTDKIYRYIFDRFGKSSFLYCWKSYIL